MTYSCLIRIENSLTTPKSEISLELSRTENSQDSYTKVQKAELPEINRSDKTVQKPEL